MTQFTLNMIKPGDTVKLTGCNGQWIIIGMIDGHRGIKVQPEILRDEPIWIDVAEITENLGNIS